MCLACGLCSEHCWSRQRSGDGGGRQGQQGQVALHQSRWCLCVLDAAPLSGRFHLHPAPEESNEPSHLPPPGLQGAPACREKEAGTCFQQALGNPHALPQHWHLQPGPARCLVLSLPLGATAMILCRVGQPPSSTASSGKGDGYSSCPVSP